jgi:hypothetical protein
MKGRALWLADVLSTAGLNVIEEQGWKTAGKDPGDLRFTGILDHHTGSLTIGGKHQSFGTVTKGRPDLSGPLCNWYICRANDVHLIASGKANHAGTGKWNGMTTSAQLLGCEIEHTGFPPGFEALAERDNAEIEEWSFFTVATAATADAAVLRHLGRTAEDVAAHFEFALPPGRKPDPRGWDMEFYRQLVADQLARAPGTRRARGRGARNRDTDPTTSGGGPVQYRNPDGDVVALAPPPANLVDLGQAVVGVAANGNVYSMGAGAPIVEASIAAVKYRENFINRTVTKTPTWDGRTLVILSHRDETYAIPVEFPDPTMPEDELQARAEQLEDRQAAARTANEALGRALG